MPINNYKDGLVTERLYTRFLVLDDIETWATFFKDKEATKHLIGCGNITYYEWAKLWVERQLIRYKENRGGLQALLSKKTHEFIGLCGILLQDIDGNEEIEVGYHIFKKYWGQGYAPEAAKAFLDYGFKIQKASSIISIIDIRNIKSQRVAEKNGLKREKQVRWMDIDVFIYRITSK